MKSYSRTDQLDVLELDAHDVARLVDEFLVPSLDGKFDRVVGVLNAGKPVADIVADRLHLPVDYVRCVRNPGFNAPGSVLIEGRRLYGERPLFVDDACADGLVAAAIRKVYPEGVFSVLAAELELFQPIDAFKPWVTYVSPKDLVIGAVYDGVVRCEWEGQKFPLPVNEMSAQVFLKGYIPNDSRTIDAYRKLDTSALEAVKR